jgi:deoxyribodipyrimidine photo-lyase
MTQPTIIWFRQDLRLADNAALTAACAQGPILPVYILDEQSEGLRPWGGASTWWLHESLAKLNAQLPLILRRGPADRILSELIAETKASAVFFTRDYAPWSTALEHRVKLAVESQGATCQRYGGFLLHEPETIRNLSGEPYKVYTPFSRACFALGEPRPAKPVPKIERWSGNVSSDNLTDWHLQSTTPNWAKAFPEHWQPGEAGARQRLNDFIADGLNRYADGRDRPDQPNTSRLSAHLHWGEISPIQCWHTVRQASAAAGGTLDRSAEKFLKEVLWREFSYHLLHHWPKLGTEPFKPEYVDFPWADDPEGLEKWQRGLTGYPIVDAGMRELWATGTMHNRVRMIAASFLIKDLLVPWQQGEAWFWDTLCDADVASNAASWQWVAGCGADAAPYFRIFNPVLQGEKFDPDGTYVRRWVPEIATLSNEFVHRPWDAAVPPGNYPRRIVDHAMARDRALAALKLVKGAPSP